MTRIQQIINRQYRSIRCWVINDVTNTICFIYWLILILIKSTQTINYFLVSSTYYVPNLSIILYPLTLQKIISNSQRAKSVNVNDLNISICTHKTPSKNTRHLFGNETKHSLNIIKVQNNSHNAQYQFLYYNY